MQGLKVIQDRLRKVVSLKGPQSSMQRIKVGRSLLGFGV